MRRFKIFAGSIFLAIALLFLIIKGWASDAVHSTEPHTISESDRDIVDDEAVRRYRLRKKELTTALKKYFDSAIASGDIVGAGVSIVQGDSILIFEGFGKRSIDGKAKIDGKTIFRLGSLSKGFAGVLAASLQADGLLDWNDKVVDYIPGFRFGDSLNTQKVKLSHILSHSSGTPYHSFTNLVEAGLPVATIAQRFHEVTPISEPGAMYSYQNAMFSLSQEVMYTVTGKDIKDLLNNRFFKPLGMSTISMEHHTLTEAKNVAMPHARRKNGWKSLPLTDHYYNAVVAGGINASSLDMAKWMRFLLGHNPEVLSPGTFQKAFNPFVEIGYNNKYYQRWPGHIQSHYGFGWRIHKFQEVDSRETKTMYHHGGSVNNYRNEIALFPEADLGICILLNGNSRLAQTVIPDVYAIVQKMYIDL
ncbi:serine hydrolase domain-containing protein [Maribacter arenosus]|uniref:serine hydrolase domain-containing protein n=1 Tax=Maribacter arenosus TaxID=1854708 RepID=UPI00293BD434|nr:serine hydrolase domain-containing protein [Maribacter arenosus]